MIQPITFTGTPCCLFSLDVYKQCVPSHGFRGSIRIRNVKEVIWVCQGMLVTRWVSTETTQGVLLHLHSFQGLCHLASSGWKMTPTKSKRSEQGRSELIECLCEKRNISKESPIQPIPTPRERQEIRFPCQPWRFVFMVDTSSQLASLPSHRDNIPNRIPFPKSLERIHSPWKSWQNLTHSQKMGENKRNRNYHQT